MKKKLAPRHLLIHLERLLPIAIILLFIGIWEGLARSGMVSTLFFPLPTKIIRTTWTLLTNGKMAANTGVSMARLGLGLLLGTLPGLILGLLMGWSSRLRSMIDPLIAAIHPIPKVAIFPLIMIIFGIGELSKIVAIGIGAFFPMLINSMTGVRQLNPVYLDVARNYGAGVWKTFTRVILPGSFPMILAGTRIAFNMALIVSITTELLTARHGLGVMIWYAWETLRTEEMYATLIVIAAIGFSVNYLLQQASRRFAPWYNRPEQNNN